MTVLIAFDGSEDSRAAVEYAGRHLKPEPTVILTVWEPLLTQLAWMPIAAAAPIVMRTDEEQWNQEEEQAHKIAEAGVELARASGMTDVSPRCERRGGPIWSVVVDTAAELEASLVVTGSRGLSGVRSVLLGSVSNRILHHVHCPTLVVPHGRAPQKGG